MTDIAAVAQLAEGRVANALATADRLARQMGARFVPDPDRVSAMIEWERQSLVRAHLAGEGE